MVSRHNLRARGRDWRRNRPVQRRARALRALAEPHLPAEFDQRDPDRWPVFGSALLSRMTTTLEQTMRLQPGGLVLDAGTLVRSLYEHLVHLAWLAADPSPARIEQWMRDDLGRRIAAANDAKLRGVELMTDEALAALKAQHARMKGDKLVLDQMAHVADKYWSTRLPEMNVPSEPTSLRGMYALLYRNYSSTAHPSYMGLNPIVEDVGPFGLRVIFEPPGAKRPPYGLATVVYGVGLLIAEDALGWPNRDAVLAVFDRFPTA